MQPSMQKTGFHDLYSGVHVTSDVFIWFYRVELILALDNVLVFLHMQQILNKVFPRGILPNCHLTTQISYFHLMRFLIP